MTENCIKLNGAIGSRKNKLFLFNVLKDGDSEIDSAFPHKNFLWTKAKQKDEFEQVSLVNWFI